MDIAQKRQADRLAFLKEVYDKAQGSTLTIVDFHDVAKAIGIDATLGMEYMDYLHKVGFIEIKFLGGKGNISVNGIRQIENPTIPNQGNAQTSNSQYSTFNNFAPITGAQIQVGSHGSFQTISSQTIDQSRQDLVRFVKEVRDNLDIIGLMPDAKQTLSEDMDTIDIQLKSKNPKSLIVRESLKSARTILEGAVGSVGGALLQSHLHRLLPLLGL